MFVVRESIGPWECGSRCLEGSLGQNAPERLGGDRLGKGRKPSRVIGRGSHTKDHTPFYLLVLLMLFVDWPPSFFFQTASHFFPGFSESMTGRAGFLPQALSTSNSGEVPFGQSRPKTAEEKSSPWAQGTPVSGVWDLPV